MNLYLDASRSYDPNRIDGTKEIFTWSCLEYPSLSPCFIPDMQNPTRMKLLLLPATKKVTIDGGKLPPGSS